MTTYHLYYLERGDALELTAVATWCSPASSFWVSPLFYSEIQNSNCWSASTELFFHHYTTVFYRLSSAIVSPLRSIYIRIRSRYLFLYLNLISACWHDRPSIRVKLLLTLKFYFQRNQKPFRVDVCCTPKLLKQPGPVIFKFYMTIFLMSLYIFLIRTHRWLINCSNNVTNWLIAHENFFDFIQLRVRCKEKLITLSEILLFVTFLNCLFAAPRTEQRTSVVFF